MNYYRRYIGDYGRDTTALSLAEHGAYALLLDAYYADEHPLPADLSMLNRICRATDKVEQAAVKRVAEKFFPVNGDGLRHNTRADREIGKAKTAIEQMAEAGHRGARRRWGKDAGADAGGDAGADRVPHRKQPKKDGVVHAGGDAGTDAGGNAGGNATSIHQPPSTSLQPPTATPQPRTGGAAAARTARRKESEAKTAATWAAFTEAYEQVWRTQPTRNAHQNAEMAKFVELVPLEEAPAIAAFYVRHSKAAYVERQHPVHMLRQDAAGLRTQWLSGRTVTSARARQADQTASNVDQINALLDQARREKAA